MIKKITRKIHLWLGLISGLLVFIIAITGCLYAFQDEIQNCTDEYRYTTLENKPVLSPTVLQKIAKDNLPGKELHSLKYFNNGKSVEAIFYHYEPTYYYKMYINPYTGKMLHIQDMDKGFFNFILQGHLYLWLPMKVGVTVVLIATLVFAIMVISGIILWFPKTKNIFKQRSWFRWKKETSSKRKQWDLHAITGFYICLFAITFIITGLVWVLPGFGNVWHKLIGGTKQMSYIVPVCKQTKANTDNSLDVVFNKVVAEHTNAASIEIHPPENDSASILAVTNVNDKTFWQSNYIYYNQYTLQEMPVNNIWGKFCNADNADKILRLNYDIHVGAALGLTGKVLAFFMSLFIASLPVTGFLIWFGRFKKNNLVDV